MSTPSESKRSDTLWPIATIEDEVEEVRQTWNTAKTWLKSVTSKAESSADSVSNVPLQSTSPPLTSAYVTTKSVVSTPTSKTIPTSSDAKNPLTNTASLGTTVRVASSAVVQPTPQKQNLDLSELQALLKQTTENLEASQKRANRLSELITNKETQSDAETKAKNAALKDVKFWKDEAFRLMSEKTTHDVSFVLNSPEYKDLRNQLNETREEKNQATIDLNIERSRRDELLRKKEEELADQFALVTTQLKEAHDEEINSLHIRIAQTEIEKKAECERLLILWMSERNEKDQVISDLQNQIQSNAQRHREAEASLMETARNSLAELENREIELREQASRLFSENRIMKEELEITKDESVKKKDEAMLVLKADRKLLIEENETLVNRNKQLEAKLESLQELLAKESIKRKTSRKTSSLSAIPPSVSVLPLRLSPIDEEIQARFALPAKERFLDSFKCTYEQAIGTMYLTTTLLCFGPAIKTKQTQCFTIPIKEISVLNQTKSVIGPSNTLEIIKTNGKMHSFGFLSRKGIIVAILKQAYLIEHTINVLEDKHRTAEFGKLVREEDFEML